MFSKKKKSKHPVISDKQEIAVIFNRMFERNQSLHLKFGEERLLCKPLAVESDHIFIACSMQDRERYNISANGSVQFSLFHEGKEYYATANLSGSGKMEGKDALRLNWPPSIKINDDYCLTQLNLIPKKSVTFTSITNQICDGDLINIGVQGIDLRNKGGESNAQVLKVDQITMVAFDLEPGVSIAQKGRVLYHTQFGQDLVGVEFVDMNQEVAQKLEKWVSEQVESKKMADKSWLQKGGAKQARKKSGGQAGSTRTMADREDYETIVKEGDPYVLLITRDEAIIKRLTKSLSRKYGILASKGRFKRVESIVGEYHPVMIIIHDQLGQVSGFDLTRTINKHLSDEFRILVMGTDEDRVEKQALSHEAGALDYLVIEPFNMLKIFRMIDDAI